MQENDQENSEQISDSNKETLTPKISPVKAGFIGLAGGFFFYQVFGGLITILIFGMDLKTANITAFRLMTMAGEILFILLPALIFSKIIYEDVTNVIRFRFAPWQEIGLFTIGIIVLTPLLQNYLYIQNYFVENLAAKFGFINEIKKLVDSLDKLVESAYGNLLSVNNILDGAVVVAVVAFTPAICEEIMFRGFIQKSFELKFKKLGGALITAIFFGLYHFNPYAIVPLIALGFYFGFAVYKSNSIFTSIVLHFINNFTAVMLFFIFGNDELITNKTVLKADLNSSFISLFYQILLFGLVMFFIHKYYKKKESREKVNQ